MTHGFGLAATGLICIAVLSGCGGGSSSSGSTPSGTIPGGSIPSTSNPSGSTIGASSLSAQRCASDNPYRADASGTTTTGTPTTEKTWIRAYLNEAYLWYDQVPTVNAAAAAYSGPMSSLDTRGVPLPLSNYFKALKTTSTTPSGALTDKFSFTYPTKAWNQLSQSGVTAGYGIEWATISSTPPRSWRIAIIQPGSPAANLGLQRGDTLVTVDGVDFVNANASADADAINKALFPVADSSHTLTFTRAGSGSPIPATLTASSSVVVDPVPVATVVANGAHTVGYLHFTDHIASSEAKLIAAINDFKAKGVSDLVLDLRYNGGGYLYLANEMAYMIAGPTRVNGKYFEKLKYNAKRTTDNAAAATPFYDTSCLLDSNYNCANEQPLPTLNLGRVYVLAQGGTCSASESIINGLSGIDVEVVLIGGKTCGKPYGFTAKDNCGVSYFPIEFKGENFKGFGDYADGFAPVTANPSSTNLLGCPTGDDLDHNLGNASEHMLATALQHMTNGTCLPPIATVTPAVRAMERANAPGVGELRQLPPVRQSRVLLPPGSRQ